MASAAYKGSA
ncbi:hypothetical protein CP8484711_0150A, partial [Chlamydia psittaci 84-8471/1]